MEKQSRGNCFEGLIYPKEYIRNYEIIREKYKPGKNKNTPYYSKWMKIGMCKSGYGFVNSEGMSYSYYSGSVVKTQIQSFYNELIYVVEEGEGCSPYAA